MKRRMLLSLSAVAAASMLLAVPAMAKQYKTEDGNITIELPDEGWSELIDPEAEFVFTNGADFISAMKYDPEEKVEVTRNDDFYDAVVQLTYAYQDELFVLTGKVVDAPHVPEVFNAITSIKFSGIASENDEKKNIDNYSVSDADATMYVGAEEGLNLRSNFSISSDILTTIEPGEAVHVTGIVKLNGKEIGWSRVEYNGKTGYVSSSNLVNTKEDAEKAQSGSNSSFPVNAADVSYYDIMYKPDGTQVKVAVMKDYSCYDMNGKKYVGFADNAVKSEDGTVLYSFDPTKTTLEPWQEQEAYDKEILNYDYLYMADGTPVQITKRRDGSRYDMNGLYIYGIADGELMREDGVHLYAVDPNTTSGHEYGENVDNGAIYLTSTETGEMCVVWSGGDGYYYAEDGREFWRNESHEYLTTDGLNTAWYER